MEVEIRNGEVQHIARARELQLPASARENDLCILLVVEILGVQSLEEGNCFG
jgi:hypothetical protein